MIRQVTGLFLAAATCIGGSAAHAACANSFAGTWRATMSATGDQAGRSFTGSCRLTFAANGAYRGVCKYTSIGGAITSSTASGRLVANASCEISGTMSAPNVNDTTVQGGYLAADQAIFFGARDNPAVQVRMVVMLREPAS